MAVLTDDQKKYIRREASTIESEWVGTGATWTKAEINAAIQAIEDYVKATPPDFSPNAREKIEVWVRYQRIGASVVQDWFDANKNALSSEINAAAGASTFTVDQKRRLFMAWVVRDVLGGS